MTYDTADYFVWEKKRGLFTLSDHFDAYEFECPCKYTSCIEQKIAKKLIEKLDTVRSSLKCPLHVNSGYRCAKYQEELRNRGYETSAGVSQHELGNAADIFPVGQAYIVAKKVIELRDLVSALFKAVGEARTFFHVDLRDDKTRRWVYSKK